MAIMNGACFREDHRSVQQENCRQDALNFTPARGLTLYEIHWGAVHFEKYPQTRKIHPQKYPHMLLDNDKLHRAPSNK